MDIKPYQSRTFTTKEAAVRNWLLRLPDGYQSSYCADVIFNFHGATSTAVKQFRYADFSEIADSNNIILITPDANKTYPNKEHKLASYWNSAWEANLRQRNYDIDFILELVELVKGEHCTNDFFATGMSAGGDMVSALACLESTLFLVFAPVTYRYYNPKKCANAAPRPTISFQGDKDFVVPVYGYGEPWPDPPMVEIMRRWGSHNKCDMEPLKERVSDAVVRTYWKNCKADTEWYLIEGGGHTWPGGMKSKRLGHTTTDISATKLIWKFFDSQ